MRLGLFVAASLSALALAAVPQSGARGLLLPRATADRTDDVTGAQVHAMYVLPSDGVDRSLDTGGTIAASVGNFQTWLKGETGDRGLRLDTYGGEVDVTYFVLDETDAQMAANGVYLRDVIEQKLHAAGFDATDKIYAVYYDGTNNDQVCGGGAWPPTLPGDTAALYLRATYDATLTECYNPSLSPSGLQIMDYAMLHELLHTLGFVPECAPNHTLAGHVSDSPNDLMYAGSDPWYPTTLDVDGNDYYAAGVSGCQDLSTNAYLQGTPTAVRIAAVAARATAAGATVTWRTASEAGLLGFHVRRGDARGKRSVQLTRRLIPAAGGPYRLVDRSARRAGSYVYVVEALARDGSRVSVATATLSR